VTPQALRALIASRLDPLDGRGLAGGAPRSDFDLNPGMRPPGARSLQDAAVLVPILERPEGLTVLLTRRADSLSRHAGQIALPGGRLDPGETPVEGALREAFEEIGLAPGFVEPLGLSTRYETGSGYVITPVVALVRPGFTIAASADEVAEVFETPFAFLMDPQNHRREFYDFEGGRRWFYVMPWMERRIWGATAGILRALWDRLFGDGGEAQRVSSVEGRGG
jgi:8-oxo-dGTP pyrophosphatase MutT (NUDIX family)